MYQKISAVIRLTLPSGVPPPGSVTKLTLRSDSPRIRCWIAQVQLNYSIHILSQVLYAELIVWRPHKSERKAAAMRIDACLFPIG